MYSLRVQSLAWKPGPLLLQWTAGLLVGQGRRVWVLLAMGCGGSRGHAACLGLFLTEPPLASLHRSLWTFVHSLM